MSSLATSIVDLILGRVCAGCEEPGSILCTACRQDLYPRPHLRRDIDLSDLEAGLRIPVACSLDYRGSVRQVIFRYKDHGIRSLARELGPALAAAIDYVTDVSTEHPSDPILVPMPARRISRRRRGFDHVRLLADQASSYTGGRSGRLSVSTILRDTRSDAGSKRLGVAERELHTRGAFATASPLPRPDQPVIVIDDIVTTGTTAREVAATLILAGVNVIGVATVAGTP